MAVTVIVLDPVGVFVLPPLLPPPPPPQLLMAIPNPAMKTNA